MLARIGLGTNRLKETDANVAFVRAAVEAGLRHIDTAHLYTGGESERTIGAALGGDLGDVVVATKGGYRAGEGHPEVLREQIEESLRALRTDVIPLYYLHRIDPETPLETSLETIKEYVDRGAIRAVGISDVGVDEIERARSVLPIAAVQNEYNLGARDREDVIDHCEAHGISIVPFFPLRGGGRAVDEVARRLGATPNQVKLAWLLRQSPVMAPIPGTLSLSHLRENLAAPDLVLSEDDVAAL